MWLAIFLLITVAASLALSLFGESRQETVQHRLERLVAQRETLASFATRDLPGNPLAPEPEVPEEPPRPTLRQTVVGLVEKATHNRRYSSRLATRLQRAGWRWKSAEFIAAQGLGAVLGLGIGLVFAPRLLLLLPLVGLGLPHFLLQRSEKARLKTFDQQLPDALAIVANALRSGYSFLQAMDVVSREMPDPISKEFSLVLRECRVNIPVEQALLHMVDRVKSPDLDLMVTAVVIQRQVGGNLAEVLEKIGVTIKDRIRLLGEVRTLTTQGRTSGWIVSMLPVALALLFQVVSPGYITPLFTHPVGWALLAIGVVMQGIGIMTIRRMVNLEV